MNDRHRTILRWYKRHKNKSIRENCTLIRLYAGEFAKCAKELARLSRKIYCLQKGEQP